MRIKTLLATAMVAAGLVAAGQAAAQEKLTVWWQKGFYKAEDDALYAAIKKFEAKNPKYKIDAVAVRAAGDDPEDGGRARRGQRRPT